MSIMINTKIPRSMAALTKNRSKPKSTHVRTGCVTCKRRRVKCDEGKPLCTRCLRGGFKCDGYDVPKTWLFEASNKPRAESAVSKHELLTPDSGLLDSSSHNSSLTCTPSPSTCLQYGNSDPFQSCAILITPFEHRYITYYREQIIPQLYHLYLQKWTVVMASDDWNHCVNCLNDETAAYALLARNVAIEIVLSQGLNAAPSTLLLYYLTKSQASLRKKLTAMTNIETSQSIYPVMWTTFFLGFAELLVKAPTSIFHVTALSRLVMRYVEAMGPDLDRNALLYLVYVDVQRSCVTLTRPVFDFFRWFPRFYEGDWAAARQRVCLPPDAYSTDVHPDIKDETIRAMILVKREGQYIYRDLIESCFRTEGEPLISLSVHSRNLLFQGQVVNVAIDTVAEAERLPFESVEGQEANVRAFIALAVLHWGRFASQAPVAGKLLFDDAPTIIPCLRSVLMRTKQTAPSRDTELKKDPGPYADARLWALFVGSQAEQNRQEILGYPKLCGDWFIEAFQAQAKRMDITSWGAMIPIFQRFLYSDKLKPHISQWWQAPDQLEPHSAK